MLRRVMMLGAVMLVVGAMGACESSNKKISKTDPSLQPPAATSQTTPEVVTAPVAGSPTLPDETAVTPPTMEVTGPVTPGKTGTKVAGKTGTEAKSTAAAKVVTDAKKTPGEFYLTIVAVKSEEMAKNDAAFLAKKGISTSVIKSGSLYRVESVDGFAKTSDADAKAFKAKVIAAGKAFPGASATKGAWDDAYFAKAGGTTAVKTAAKPKTATKTTTTAAK